MENNILNVTLLEPRQKHPAIFESFDALKEGESLTIHNDHDPKPLYYQLLGERGDTFAWEYLAQGPEWWEVRIIKNNSRLQGKTLGEIATSDLRKAQVFKKYGLDFCCGGKKTLKQACAEKGLDLTRIEDELRQTDQQTGGRAVPYHEWSPEFLADYIVNTHHSYVKSSLPEIRSYAAKVARVHGNDHPELIRIDQLVNGIAEELTSHMEKEEHILFPFIRTVAAAVKTGRPIENLELDGMEDPIAMMEAEHELAGGMLEQIRTLSNNFALPATACASYSLLYRMLEEFETDLHIHVHLENNILFPKITAL